MSGAGSLAAAIILHKSGRVDDAVNPFLHGSLNFPQALES
jgi:hypothetical protein